MDLYYNYCWGDDLRNDYSYWDDLICVFQILTYLMKYDCNIFFCIYRNPWWWNVCYLSGVKQVVISLISELQVLRRLDPTNAKKSYDIGENVSQTHRCKNLQVRNNLNLWEYAS